MEGGREREREHIANLDDWCYRPFIVAITIIAIVTVADFGIAASCCRLHRAHCHAHSHRRCNVVVLVGTTIAFT